jgi:hypothetical protein
MREDDAARPRAGAPGSHGHWRRTRPDRHATLLCRRRQRGTILKFRGWFDSALRLAAESYLTDALLARIDFTRSAADAPSTESP